MPEAEAAVKGSFVDRLTTWINEHLVPITNKLQNMYWFSIIGETVLYIVPFTMVSMIPSLWAIIRNYITWLPDISALSTYSFGMVGLFISFIIPHKVLIREGREDRAVIGGCTGVGTYLLCMGATTTDDGFLFPSVNYFGGGGMFTALVVGWYVGLLFKKTANKSFFSEDSLFPDFVKNWFDNILVIFFSLFTGWIFTYALNIDLFTAIQIIISPVTSFADSLPGVILIALIMDGFYYFGISAWIWTSVTSPIGQANMAENAALAAAGEATTHIYTYGFTRYTQCGGEGMTLPLAIMLLFSKSKRLKLIGKATIVPSLLNTNEPLFYSVVVQNPYMFIPVILQAIIVPANTYLWMSMGWASMNTQSYGMYFIPNAIAAYIASAGDWRNALLCVVNVLIAAVIWFPFWKAYDNYLVQEEAKELEDQEAKKAAKKAERDARRAAAAAAAGDDNGEAVVAVESASAVQSLGASGATVVAGTNGDTEAAEEAAEAVGDSDDSGSADGSDRDS